jgi:hypothetical protein
MRVLTRSYVGRFVAVALFGMCAGIPLAHATMPAFDPNNLNSSFDSVFHAVMQIVKNIHEQGLDYIWTLARQLSKTLFNAIVNP